MNACSASAIAISGLFCAFGAQNPADRPKFEAASVKVADQCSMENSVDPGRIALIGDPLKVILKEAFNVKMDQIIGPSWLDTECYAIVAKIPEGAAKDQMPAMFEALLVERFKLAFHRESHMRAGYALMVDKNGPKLKQTDPSFHGIGLRSGQIRFTAASAAAGIKGSITLATLARLLSNRLDGPVEDLTGIEGKFDIDLNWAPDPTLEKIGQFAQQQAATASGSADAAASLPAGTGNLFNSIRDSLGLKLEPRKQAVETIVIDHIERIPVEN
jgi:uncharacterized protein (TIGR03435 family)